MLHKIRVGDRVYYNNLVCSVISVEHAGSKEFLELQPVGSSARVSADSNQVTKIMSEGIKDTISEEPLYD